MMNVTGNKNSTRQKILISTVELEQNAAVKAVTHFYKLFLYLNCKIISSVINNTELIFSIQLRLHNAVFEWLVMRCERNL